MARHDAIKGAYKALGKEANFYDGMMTCSTLLGTSVSKLVWSIGKEKNEAYIEKALSGIPADFAGKLLEVPVGTGVLTVPVYRTLPNADITCLDYSESMMASAQKKAQMLGISSITFRQGDVGKLPFPDESFDIVLSMNGFHAFPDKEAAYRETFRVLKMGPQYLERYERHFKNPDIRRHELQHEELLTCYPEEWVREVIQCCGVMKEQIL